VRVEREVMVLKQREIISPALHFRKTSPTNSPVSGEEEGFSGEEDADGEKCQGLEKVSVRARCCSAITRREIRWGTISQSYLG
jgi:hypothetical protein